MLWNQWCERKAGAMDWEQNAVSGPKKSYFRTQSQIGGRGTYPKNIFGHFPYHKYSVGQHELHVIPNFNLIFSPKPYFMFCPISLNLTQFTQNRGSENGKRSQHGLNKHRQNPDQVMFGENHSSGQLCVEYCLENKWASTKSNNNISGQAPNTISLATP